MNAGDLLWQSTLLLGLGALASLAHRGRPARGHHALLLAAAMTLALPALALGVGALGWGLLPAPSAGLPAALAPPLSAAYLEPEPPPLVGSEAPVSMASSASSSASPPPGAPVVAGNSASGASLEARAETPPSSGPLPWRRIALLTWAVLSLLAGWRLVQSWHQARGLLAESRPATSPALCAALERAADGLGLVRRPRLVESEAVPSPLLWPWEGDGIVLVPPGAAAQRGVEWGAVFAHELAHLRRRDHHGLLLSNLLVILLPWQPLAWWCRRQIARLADLACDDWVLASGHPRADYAGALLAFVPATSRAWAQAAVSNGGTLRQRVRRILESRGALPLIGRGWSGAAGALALLVALGVACTQPRDPEAATEPATQGQNAAGDPQSGVGVNGLVRDPAGQPRSGVSVRAAVSTAHGLEVRWTTTTDLTGHFSFPGLDPDLSWTLSADHPDFARQWIAERRVDLTAASTPIDLVLQEPQRLAGVVRNAEGQPVADVRLTLLREFLGDPMDPLQGSNNQELAVTTTDAEGRFSLDRLRAGWVSLMLDHPEYARTFTGLPRPQVGQLDVELFIERGYTLRGRVTAGGKPLPDVAIKTSTPNAADRPIGEWSVRTDELGRFELRGVSTKLSRSASSSGWPLVTLSVDDPQWSSPSYRIYDEGKPQLPEVELKAVPRDPTSSQDESEIDVNRPTSGTVARLAGHPSGTAGLRVALDVPARTRQGELRQVWLAGPAGASSWRRESVDESGVIVFDQLAPGDYSVMVPRNEPPLIPQLTVSLHEGETRELRLHPGPARVHGTVTCDGQPVTRGSIDVNIWQSEPAVGLLQGYGVVNRDGTWEVEGLPFGRYRITYDNGEGGHSVPNYFVVDVSQPETHLDLALPRTRIDFTLPSSPMSDPDIFGNWTKDKVFVHPGGTLPAGGNTSGNIDFSDGQHFVEHLPPGRWTLRTRWDNAGLVARVVLPDDTSHATVELAPTDGGSATIKGTVVGLDLVRTAEVRPSIRIEAYPKDAEGLDVTAGFGRLSVDGDRYELQGLPAGRYGLLIGPSYELEELSKDEAIVPHIYLPEVVVAEGQVVMRDITLPSVRNVSIETRADGGDTPYGSWRIDLGGGDWLPFHLFVGSEPRALIGPSTAFPLAVGEHRLEVTFRGEAPQVHALRVEPGDGVQEIEIVRAAGR